MKEFIRPTILFSSCLGEKNCRYDGSCIKVDFLEKLKKYANIIHTCPEMGMGLPSPREALRLVLNEDDQVKLVFSKTGGDMTKEMEKFAGLYLDQISKTEIHGAVLKGRSPSCGIKDVKVYKDYGKSPTIPKKARGVFGNILIERFEDLAIEDEGRLTNYNIREHFFTRIFTYARFKEIKTRNSIKELIDFHSDNKYLLMAYSQGNLKKLGKLVANHEGIEIKEVLNQYEIYLKKALATIPNTSRNINMLLHLLGYFSKDLSKDEKAHFLNNIEDYQRQKIPFSVPLSIIYIWVVRFQNKYLLNQTIFNSFPKDLIEVTDSGKGI